MKTYLNREEINGINTLLALTDEADTIANEWDKRGNLTFTERKYLRTANTMLRKTIKEIFDRIDTAMKQKITRTASEWRVCCLPKDSLESYQKRIEAENTETGVWCRNDAFDGLAEMALIGCCAPCIVPPDSRETCICRKSFLELGVPAYDERPEEGVCPYEQSK